MPSLPPICKKGLSSDPANYRPESRTNVFGKIMERVIAADMIDYLLTNKLLNPSQHSLLRVVCVCDSEIRLCLG